MPYPVFFYQTARGDKPVQKFINSFDDRLVADFFHLTELLSQLGPKLPLPYSKKLTKNLYELRIKSKIEVRVIYSHRRSAYYLLHAFQKKTNKTPLKELRTAKSRSLTLI